MWAFLSRNRDAGLLMLRLTLGALFLWAHGWAKLTGGIDGWRGIGSAMSSVGITFWPVFWGFMATMAETAGIVLFIIGFAFRPACLLVAFTMAIAGVYMWHHPLKPIGLPDSASLGALGSASHAWELGLVFFSMIFIGPGKYSVDKN
jgi:putative oxidoreductase